MKRHALIWTALSLTGCTPAVKLDLPAEAPVAGVHGRTKQGGSARGAARSARPARLPRAARGQLRRGDATLQSGEFVDRLRVRFPVGQPVQLRLTSRAIDPYLIVRSPTGRELQNDDLSDADRNSGIDLEAAEDGDYTILVTSYRAGESGAYQLRYVTGQPAAPAPHVTAPGSGPAVAPPSSGTGTSTGAPSAETGELRAGDATLRGGEFYDTYQRTVTAGHRLHIRLESTAFDPDLIVRTPGGEQLDNDDTTNDDRNSTVDIAVSEAGTYTIQVTSYQAGETGAYRLQIEGDAGRAANPPSASGNATPPPSSGTVASAAGGGRVFGIFGGISDYPGAANDLDDCADDATKLAQALERANLMTASQQIVLTDGAMTTGALRDAMTRMATTVGPDDIFLLFYSGHGGQDEGSHDAREIDGIDETLYLYDGSFVDDELGRLFDGIHGRLAVLALDSCFSGGFAKDVITAPGRVGFFSSEEDVTSAVASEFHAGGYLSYFLREGASGAADANPHDGLLTVGELEHYLYGQFGQHATNVVMDGAFQHLVADRGAVRSDQPMWTFR